MVEKVKHNNIQVKNFMGFRKLEMPFGHRLTLIGGNNSVGKTSILDAVFITLGPGNPELWVNVLGRKQVGITFDETDPISYLFHELKHWREITLEVQGGFDYSVNLYSNWFESEDGNSYKVEPVVTSDTDSDLIVRKPSRLIQKYVRGNDVSQFEVKPEKDGTLNVTGPVSTVFQSSVYLSSFSQFYGNNALDRFSRMVENQGKNLLIKAIQSIHPEVSDLEIVTKQRGAIFVATTKDLGVVPVSILGSGVYRLLDLLLSISSTIGGAVLVDEIESGFHYSVYKNIWKVLLEFADKFDCKLIFTTHSGEFLAKGLSVIEAMGNGKEILYNRIDKTDRGHKTVSYSYNMLQTSLEDAIEVR